MHAELPRAHAEMNLTPLIDILLVLLVIFLRGAAAHAESHRQPAAGTDPRDAPNGPSQIVVEYTADRRLSINHEDVR